MNPNLIHLIIYLHILSSFLTLYPPSSAAPLALNCGSKDGGNDADNRKWESDSKYLVAGGKSVSSTALTHEPSLSSDVPYMTARIFTGETSYKFDVNSTSRYILRLHFYPSDYPNFNVSNSYSVVTTNSITLLKNFSAFITAEALSQAYLIKEFSLAAFDSDSITVTFKPADKSFAFVNGIELITEPELFDDQAGLVGVEENSGTIDGVSSNMQNMFRLNVGGQYIPPTNDSGGLMRSWYDDTPYMFGAGTISHKANVTIDYKELPEATAPADVYRTARSQGPDPNINKQSNVTWLFPVDANFTYLVRFHFCEYQIDKINQRVFEIYLNNETAFATADIIAWTGGKGIPTRKDYAIYIGDKSGDEELWVTLHTNIDLKPEFYDVLLNGLEVFKISDSKSNLAGKNPVPSEMMQKQLIANREAYDPNAIQVKHVVGGAMGGAATIGVAMVVLFVIRRRKREGSDLGVTGWLPVYGNSTSKSTMSRKSQCGSNLSSDAVCNCRYFSLVEIKSATNNFEEGNVLCARPALNPNLPKEQVSLADYALQSARRGTLEEMVDPHLKGMIKPESFKKFTDCSLRCLADHGMERPSMGDVLWTLEFVLKQETKGEEMRNEKKSGSSGGGTVEVPIQSSDMIAMHMNTLNLDDDEDDYDSDDDGNAFSQIVDPKGR
ncbi:hypothetical protein L1987_50402 [Smallanthus sonchifolius]|uniref:Uncharacterized protein n=1 Tax=Smallanthus sonchifolius TaxID=185202 RepID=A0ACB9ELX5_9ASTR|nr:hypothetical protein L1987_50402 [Smallanthus sonchifolius]